MKVFVVLTILIAGAFAAPSVNDNKVSDDSTFNSFVKYFANCADSGEVTTCLAVKGIAVLNRAARSSNINIIPGVTFTRDSSSAATSRSAKALSENDIFAALPAEDSEKNGRLLDLAMSSVGDFVSTHSLTFKLPAEARTEIGRAFEEGRGKMKKVMGPLAIAIGAKLIALVPIFLGGLVLLATKALVIAKIAFILAAIVALQKVLGGGSGLGSGLLAKVAGGQNQQAWPAANGNAGWSSGGAGQQAWSSGAGTGSYPYARSYDAQDLAYSAQAPATQ